MSSYSTQSLPANSAPKELTKADLSLLCEIFNPVAPKCFELGLRLGVEEARIKIIITNNKNDCEVQLREIISERLKQGSPLTWHDIVTAVRSPTVGENSLASQIEQEYLQQPMWPDRGHYRSQSPVRGPSGRGHYRSQSPVRGPSDGGHYRSQSPVRGPSDRGHYRSQSPVRGPSYRGNYRSRSPARAPSDRRHYKSPSPARGPSDRWHYRSRSPVRGPSDRGHYRSRSPVRGPSDRRHYKSQSPVRGPSDRWHYRSRSPARAPSDRRHYKSPSPARGPSDRRHYKSQSPVRGPSDRRHYRSRSPARAPSDRRHYKSQSPVRGPSDRGHYRSRSPARGPSDRRHYKSQSPVRGPSDREHYRSRSPVRGPSDRGHYRSQSPVRGPSDRGHYRSRSPVRGPSDRGHYRSRSPVRGPSDRGHYRSRSPARAPSDRRHYKSPSPVRGPSDRWHYRSWSPARGPSDRRHYKSQSPVRGPSDREHYRSRSPARGPSDRRHYKSQSPVRGPSDRRHYRSRSLVKGPSDRRHYRSQSPVRGPSDRGLQSPVRGPSDRGHYRSRSQIMSPIQQFVDYLKDTYKQSRIERSLDVLKWPPTPSKVFISLACIDRKHDVSKDEADEYTRAMIEDGNIDVVLKKKESIGFADIGKNLLVTDSSERVILVEGAPGVGKSTFAWEFCRRWERGEIAQQYQLVLLLRLRDDRMSRAKNLQQLIYHPDIEDISQAVKCELVHCRGVNTLIILEGFDELPNSQRKEHSIFLKLILGQLLMHATIMITSRPWATGEIMRRIEHRIFQHIEVLGFTEENVVKYVRSVFIEKTASAIDQSVGGPDEVSEEAQKNIDDVMAYIGKYPQIKACMYIPLNAAIVVSIYQDSKKGKCILPKTLTELYYALTQILLLRYLYGHADYKEQEWNIDSFEMDLPDKVYKQLLTLCKVAYDGICRKGRKRVQLIFSDSDLGGCETLGFMQSVSEVYVKHGRKMSHNFLHLTVQEFLAALLTSTKSPAEQLEHFQRHKDGRLRVVLVRNYD